MDNRLEWDLRCVRAEDGSTRHELWSYNDLGSAQIVTSYRVFPSGEQVAASLAMWRVEHNG